jgi:ribulose-phosphate 3-epimerase
VTFLRERKPELDIMIDGGGNAETIPLAAKAGANQFVAGSYLFKQEDMKAAVDDLKARVAANR